MSNEQLAAAINVLGSFCGMRDVPELSQVQLKKRFEVERADVMAFFGGSILCGADELAKAMHNKVARHYVIVGGEGHTTDMLRRRVNGAYPEIVCAGLSEAEIFAAYLHHRYGLTPDFLECHSTNCGNNITFMLELLKKQGISYHTVILMQDATMQRRMDAGMRKYAAQTVNINYASYAAHVVANETGLTIDKEIPGMWELEHYITLLLGEIQRLADDAQGYGPRGKNYIARVEIPREVRRAFALLKEQSGGAVREANPLYATEK